MTNLKKPSEWLEENVSSHNIYLTEPMEKRYKEEVGEYAPWESYTAEELNQGSGKHKPLWEGQVKKEQRFCCGWLMAEAINRAHGGTSHEKLNGRGFIFRACIEELEAKGK